MTAPLDDPLSYPGHRPAHSWHLVGARCLPLRGPVPFDRHAVLAIGSNACPAQLVRKFGGRPCSSEVVGLVVGVGGLTVRPSAHLARSGYWPFAPAASASAAPAAPAAPGREPPCPAALCFLDDAQLDVLDATEPNYVRVRLDRSAHPVHAREQLPDGPTWVYVSRHGVVDDSRLPGWTDPPPSQRALLSALIALLPLPARLRDPDALSLALRAEPGLAATLTEQVQRVVRVREAGLGEPAGHRDGSSSSGSADPAQRVRPSENVGSSSNRER